MMAKNFRIVPVDVVVGSGEMVRWSQRAYWLCCHLVPNSENVTYCLFLNRARFEPLKPLENDLERLNHAHMTNHSNHFEPL